MVSLLPIKPLDGADGYHRWKESVLLRLHSVDVAHVLFDEPPAASAFPSVVNKWARDDAVCRGHILAALSDRLFPDYSRHGTGRALWEAVARTYDLDTPYGRSLVFKLLHFDQRAPLLEQLAHGEALAAAVGGVDQTVAYMVSHKSNRRLHYPCSKLEQDVGIYVTTDWENWEDGGLSTERVWQVAREEVVRSMERELEAKVEAEEAMFFDSMASLSFKQLDRADGYLRWKESMLLRLNSVDVAHVLIDDPPAPAGDDDDAPTKAAASAAAKKWARDDAVCRGHILAALSDRLLPVYSRHATARALWEAVARTYDLDTSPVSWSRFTEFEFDDGAPLLEQLALVESLGVAGQPLFPDFVAYKVAHKLPGDMRMHAIVGSECGRFSMDKIWKLARIMEEYRIEKELRAPGEGATVDNEE
ncbi:hypothetical protein EJB05_49038, partial [Eragrostis curvula]